MMGIGKMTELSDIIDVWSYRSIRILIYVEVGDIMEIGEGFRCYFVER